MRNIRLIITAIILTLSGISITHAQLFCPASDFADTTAYRIGGLNDSIFVVHSPDESLKASLEATGPGTGPFDFTWSIYDTITKNWNPLSTEAGVFTSSLSSLEEGGYRVEITNGSDVDTLFRCWVHLDNLVVDVTYDLVNGPPKAFCGALILNAEILPDTLFYYNFETGESYFRNPELAYIWTADPEMTIFSPSIGYSSKTIGNPPFEDTWFILEAQDYSGMKMRDSLLYETIEVKAEYSMEFFDKADTEDFIDPPSKEESAPLTVRFTNKSENGIFYEWIFSDTTGTFGSGFFENYETSILDEQPEFTYKIPDDYYPMLVAHSEHGCIDTFKLEEPLKVLPSELEAPNVFSPEGLEANRYFKVSFQSIKEFHIRIYARNGNLVYKADVTDMYSWEGWNGNIMNSDRPAAPGVYFYIIEATGYDEIRYNKGPYKGTVYLFRPKN